jgi:hypothetical protein
MIEIQYAIRKLFAGIGLACDSQRRPRYHIFFLRVTFGEAEVHVRAVTNSPCVIEGTKYLQGDA